MSRGPGSAHRSWFVVALCTVGAAAHAEAAAADVSARGTLTDGANAQYSFAATAPQSGGTPTGSIGLPNAPAPTPVECLVVRGARAVLAGSVVVLDDPGRKDVFALSVEDGEPAGEADRFSLRQERVDLTAPIDPYCSDTDGFASLQPIAAGEIAVDDGQPDPAPTPDPTPTQPGSGGGSTESGGGSTDPVPTQPPGTAPDAITSTVSHFWRVQSRRTTVLRLRVNAVPRGARTVVTCLRGTRSCPFRRRVLRRSGRVVLTHLFRGRRLRAGTTLEVRVTRPGAVGMAVRFRLRPRALPAVRRLCVAPGARRPGACRAPRG